MSTKTQNKFLLIIAILIVIRSATMAADSAPATAGSNDRRIEMSLGRTVTVNLDKVADGDARQYELARVGLEILVRKIQKKEKEGVFIIASASRPLPYDDQVDFRKIDAAQRSTDQLELAAELANAIAKAHRKRIKAIYGQHHTKSLAEFDADPRWRH